MDIAIKRKFNFSSGVTFFLFIFITFIVKGASDRSFDWGESLQIGLALGFIFFLIGALLFRNLWAYRWLKILSIGFMTTIFWLIVGSDGIISGWMSYLMIAAIPLSLIYLIFDPMTPAWLTSTAMWFSVPFWPLAIFSFVSFSNSVDLGGLAVFAFMVLVAIPIIVISTIIGIIIGIKKERRQSAVINPLK